MKYLKLFEELTWSDLEKGKFDYYVQGGEGAKELRKIKTDILGSMDPPMIDVWESISDSLLELKEKWGTFRTKYESEKEVIDFDSLDLVVDLNQEIDYIIASETDTFYNRGNTITITDRNKKEEYRKIYPDGTERKYDSRLSIYGSDFDQDFYNFYKKNGGKVTPSYSILIGFESEYINNNIDKIEEMISDLIKSVNRGIKRVGGRIIKLEYFDNDSSKWRKINDLSQTKYPRILVSFVIN